MLQSLICLVVSFLSSVAGAICGIGGGVIVLINVFNTVRYSAG